MVFGMTACGGGDEPSGEGSSNPAPSESGSQQTDGSEPEVTGEPDASAGASYTYREYVAVSPSNWNELTYKDNNDLEIMNFIGSSFFGYNFKYDAAGEIVPGEFEMEFSAATALEDISDKVDAKWNVPEGGTGYAYKITLRDGLTWEDGTPISAEDFVYSMQQQLDPLFKNYRADSYYNGATVIVNARNYVMQGDFAEGVDNGASGLYTVDDLVKGEDGVYAQPDGGMIKIALQEPLTQGSGYSVADLTAMGYLDADAFAALEELADEKGRVDITDDTIALVAKLIDTPDWGNEPPENVPLYMVYDYTYPALDFSEVGIYVGDNANELVIVLEKPLALLKEDGSLSYQAAYNMSSLPLVKKDLYEQCKIAPSEGSTLWTTNYNSSVETTALGPL